MIPTRGQRRIANSLMLLAAMMACTEVAAPNDSISLLKADMAKGPVTFALAQVGDKVMEPMITSDLQCGSVRTVYSDVDTVTLSADGVARRAYTSIMTVNGVLKQVDAFVSPGLWAPIRGPNIYYYSDSPSIVVTVFSGPDRIPIDLNFRLRGTTALTQLGSIGGGACPGGALTQALTVERVYTRR